MKKDLSSMLLVVSTSILAITSAVGWVYNYQLQKEMKNLRSESQSWRNFALDATTAYVKSHGGRIPEGTLIWPSPPGNKDILVIGYNEPKTTNIENKGK